MLKLKIAPSILASDFSCAGETVKNLELWGADMVHCDVMDGNFVPSITFGHQFIKNLRPHTSLPLDCHLMTLHPETHLERFAKAGADIVSVHAEVTKNLISVLSTIRSLGMRCGAVVNPDTPVEELFDCIDVADQFLIMSVFPGWGGQKFIPESLKRIEQLREFCEKNDREIDIEVDGGITEENVHEVISAGANVIVAGSAVFRALDPQKAIAGLRA